MTEEKLKKVFLNEKFVKRLLEQKSPQDVQELLEEKDIFLSLDELLKMYSMKKNKSFDNDRMLMTR